MDPLEESLLRREKNRSLYKRFIKLRWIIVLCFCFLQTIRFICYDNAQALQTQFQTGPLQLSTTQYNLFYSIQTYLLIFPFIAGYLSDRFSIRKLMMIMMICQTIGQGFFTLGAYIESYPVLLAGRWLFEITSFSMEIYEDHMLSVWFANKEMFLAMGVGLSCCRLGTALANYFTPKIYESTKEIYLPLLYGTYLYGFALIVAVVLVFVDSKYRKFIEDGGEDQDGNNEDEEEDEKPMSLRGIITDLKSFKKLFWIIVIAGTMSYVLFDVFENNSNDMIGGLFSLSNVDMGNILFGVYIYAGIFMPLFGIFVDIKGNRLNFQLISSILAVVPISLLAFLPRETSSVWVTVILVCFMTLQSMYGVIFWAMIPFVTEASQLGTAYGTTYSFLNFFLLIFSLIIGYIRDNTLSEKGGWFWCLIFFLMVYIVNYVLQFFIFQINLKKNNFLNKVTLDQERKSQKGIEPIKE